MIIKPKIWGFVCTTAHPVGCEKNVLEQIDATRVKGLRGDGPKRVLVIGASSGYGLSSRITAAFGFGAATLGVFLEKPGTATRPATAGWYNSAAFHKAAQAAGLKAWSIDGDAFSDAARERAIDIIRRDMGGSVDLVVYSLAAPVRRLPDGRVAHSAIKPLGKDYSGKTIDTEQDAIVDVNVEQASPQEIDDTVAVMGGQDWALWIDALSKAGVLAKGAKTLAYNYIGPESTWPMYLHGTIGRAKQDLEETAETLGERYGSQGLSVHIAVMKSVVTQASTAIPVMPLYVSIMHRVMKQKGLHEETIDQANRLFRHYLYRTDGRYPAMDELGRLRLDDKELRADVQQACRDLWPKVTNENLLEITDYAEYKKSFLKLFGFGRSDVDYDADVSTAITFDCAQL